MVIEHKRCSHNIMNGTPMISNHMTVSKQKSQVVKSVSTLTYANVT